MKVDDIMSPHPVRIDADASLDEAMELMERHSVRHLPVLEGERVVGMIAERDLLQLTGWLPHGLREALEGPEGGVRDFMQPAVLSIELGDGLARAAGMIVDLNVGCLCVMDGERLAGVVSELDLLRAFVEARKSGRIPESDDSPVDECMTEAPRTAAPDQWIEDVAATMRSEGLRHMPVVSGHELVGVLSDRDVRRSVGEGRYGGTPVSEFMSTEPVTIRPEANLAEAAQRLLEERISSLLVTEHGHLRGILTTADVLGTCAIALQNAAARPRK